MRHSTLVPADRVPRGAAAEHSATRAATSVPGRTATGRCICRHCASQLPRQTRIHWHQYLAKTGKCSLHSQPPRSHSTTNLITLQDWLVSLTDAEPLSLSALNAALLQADLLCDFTAPLFTSLIVQLLPVSHVLAIFLALNVCAAGLEHLVAQSIYRKFPVLKHDKQLHVRRDSLVEVDAPTKETPQLAEETVSQPTSLTSYFRGLVSTYTAFAQHRVFCSKYIVSVA